MDFELDKHGMDIARVARKESKCRSRQVGACVMTPQGLIVGMGHNGAPAGTVPCAECPRRILGYPSGKGLELCPAVHAEAMALLEAGRNATSGTVYMTCGISCKTCAGLIITAGIKRVVGISWHEYEPYINVPEMWKNAGVQYDVYEEKQLNDNDTVCPECGSPMIPEGGCMVCKLCGYSPCL